MGTGTLSRGLIESNFVIDSGDRAKGIGWCEQVVGNEATVLYRDYPGEVAEVSVVPALRLELHSLPDEARVWVKNKGYGWWPGRSRGRSQDGGGYFVQLLGRSALIQVPPWSIHLRWSQPLSDPAHALAIGMTDSRSFYQARFGVMKSMVDQRVASRGYSAVLSAAVQPFQHQLEVLARVTGDPLMRFVLADEVGLGKTIEAGLIMRQLLLDDAEARVVVATPPHLVRQWINELHNKLLLSDHIRSGRVRVVAHADLALPADHGTTLLVIDEAHVLVEASMEDRALASEVSRTCSAVPGLLLLTATPLRGHASTFLGLLNLIDPVAHVLSDLAAFEERMELRFEQASAMELLSPQIPSRMIRSVLRDFKTGYSDDDQLLELISRTERCLDLEVPPADVLSELSTYLRETYRLSRRVIRNRRSAVADEAFLASGRVVELEQIEDPARVIVDGFLGEWRSVLLDSHWEIPHQTRLGLRFCEGVEAALGGPERLGRFLTEALEAESEGVDASERALFAQTRAQLDLRGSGTRRGAIVRLIEHERQGGAVAIAVFTDDTAVGRELLADLDEVVPRDQLFAHLLDMSIQDQDVAVRKFTSQVGPSVLVCDRSAEEGRNLQRADLMIHVDLPLSFNRLEQRLGRTDRFNASQPGRLARSIAITEPNSLWVQSHLALLLDGVGIFESSVSTLQRPLGALEAELRTELLIDGVQAFSLDGRSLLADLEGEREQIDLLEELEATQFDSDFDAHAVEDLLRFEDKEWTSVEEAFDTLTGSAGGVQVHKATDPIAGAFTYTVKGAIPLMSGDDQGAFSAMLDGRRTFDRAIAVRHEGVRPVRAGDPMVDWLDAYLRRDEGGRTWAVWRQRVDATHPETYFRFDFLLEFDDQAIPDASPATRRRLRRRGDAFLLPRIETVWFGSDGEPSDEFATEFLDVADRPGDQTLHGPRWMPVLERVPEWPKLVAEAFERADETARSREEVVNWITDAAENASHDRRRRSTVLDSWTRRLPANSERDAAMRQVIAEAALSDGIAAGIATPNVVLLAAGAVVLGVGSL